jgi:sulfonate transport system ATP-binding protein
VVLTDGRLGPDHLVDLPGQRVRTQPEFAALRTALLAELGVTEDSDHGPASQESHD